MGPKVKTFYDTQLEEARTSYKEQAIQRLNGGTATQNCQAQAECMTELFTVAGLSIRRYHLDLLTIGLQLLILIAIIKSRA